MKKLQRTVKTLFYRQFFDSMFYTMLERFQQSDFWCGFKSAHGWKSVKSGNINILVRTFKKGPFSFSVSYVPMAPENSGNKTKKEYISCLGEAAEKIKPLLPKDILYVRFDVPPDIKTLEEKKEWLLELKKIKKVSSFNIKKPETDIQPPDSTFLNLSLTEDELLHNMKERCRRNIKKAEKSGVKIRRTDASSPDFEKDLNSFYDLYKETAERDGIGLHPLSYYKDLLLRGKASEGSNTETKIFLYVARHEEDDLGAIITLFQKDEAVYLYGCSSNKKRNLMPNYLIQWTAIKDAKEYGSKIYDFYGIPPTGSENHPMHGLYLFKTGFGGEEVHRIGSVDVVFSKLYSLYILAENLRAFWHKKIMKKLRGR